MSDEKQLTPEQRKALRDLLNTNPHTWKACIRRLWMHSDQVSGERDVALYQLRGTHGHGWLNLTTAQHLKIIEAGCES